MQWFRMYAEFRNDPKVRTMPEALQLRLVLLMCLHADQNGAVDGLDDEQVAWALSVSPAELARTKKAFRDRGFIMEDSWRLQQWSKRQRDSDVSNGRVAKHRKTKDATQQGLRETDLADVTEKNRYSNDCSPLLARARQNRTDTEQNRTEERLSVSQERHTQTTPEISSPDLTRLREYVDQVTGGAWGHLAGQWTRAKPYLAESWLAAWAAVATMDPMPNQPWHYVAKVIAGWPGNVPPAATQAAKQTTATATNFDPTPEELARWEAIEREAS